LCCYVCQARKLKIIPPARDKLKILKFFLALPATHVIVRSFWRFGAAAL
jgi:hypothetical protein